MINVYWHHQSNFGKMITQTNKIRALGLERFIGEEDIIINEVKERFKPDMKGFCKFMERYGKDSKYWYIGDNIIYVMADFRKL